ncbi:MAG: HTH-type transcriptional activator IlvY [Spirochaetaceae bacterium]|nr:MAG: HTH-type transcriptional activator IlvY [Spirochaetaceae bacterium]
MDVRTLEVFLALTETRSFASTSRVCNASPSAVSRTIQRLEDELGTRLFIRDNRSVRPTSEAEIFRRYAARAVAEWQSVRDQLGGGGRLTGDIRIYASVTACYAILPDVIPEFRALYPEVAITLKTGDPGSALSAVLDDEVDLAVAAFPETIPSGVTTHVMMRTPLQFVAPTLECRVSELAGRSPVPWAELPLIIQERDVARDRVEKWYRRLGVKPRVYAHVAGNEAILAMVALGCGIGIVPGLVIEKSPIRAEVRVLDVDPGLDAYDVGIAVRTRALQSATVTAFWRVVGAKHPRGR